MKVRLEIFRFVDTLCLHAYLWIIWKDCAKWKETLEVKIGAGKYKKCLIISRKKPYRSCALFLPCFMLELGCRFSLQTTNACFVVSIRKWLMVQFVSKGELY